MQRRNNTILVVSFDMALADIRQAVLEKAGYHVVSLFRPDGITEACQRHRPRLIVIGYSVPPAEKRRLWDQARKMRNVPVLELSISASPELMSTVYFNQSEAGDEFLTTVKRVMRRIK